jgi:drug/metabolite transporter (DMT)-like permease
VNTAIFFCIFIGFMLQIRRWQAMNSFHAERGLDLPSTEISQSLRPAALAFMLGEGLVFLASLLGGNWLFLSHSLALVLLALFIYALNSVLQRKIQTNCNCFGSSEQKVSPYDIWRNTGIILIVALGLLALFWEHGNSSLLDLALSALIAFVLSLFLLNLRELMELLAL